MKIVALVSGGIDSLVMCKILKDDNPDLLPLFIDYGQLASDREWEACKKILGMIDIGIPEKIDISGYGNRISSGITNKDINIEDAFLPGRNLILLTIAASYAYQKNINIISIGLLSEETHLFPDQTQSFIVNTNVAINSALNYDFTIVTPLINFNKDDILMMAEKYKLPVKYTYSCHSGKKIYCGRCIACKEILSTQYKEIVPQFKKERE